MVVSESLTEANLLLFAARYYNNPSCFSTEEFQEDLNRLKYLKRLFNRFQETGELKERLILNHIIILHNVFGLPAATRMLFLKMKGQYELLKPFLVFLSLMPDRIDNVEDKSILSCDIPMNIHITEVLRNI